MMIRPQAIAAWFSPARRWAVTFSSSEMNKQHYPTTTTSFKSVAYSVEKHVATILLNRPKRLNAIDENTPFEIEAAVREANNNKHVKCIVVKGAGGNFCSGYDLKKFAECQRGDNPMSQKTPYDPLLDYKFMYRCTEAYMSLWRSHKPTIARIDGACIGGGTDIALSCDITFATANARIGYPPTRVWGCPTTAHWFYRLGIENAKRILFTGEILSGQKAEKIGLIGSCHETSVALDEAVKSFTDSLADIPANQLFFQKLVVNSAVEQLGLGNMQKLSTLLDGMTRHTPEGVAFQERCRDVGFKKAVLERDSGQMTEQQTANDIHQHLRDIPLP